MGFDINVMMELFMCPATGKPFYYGYDKDTKKTKKIYDLPNIVVPEKMCEYLVGRGHHFHAYTRDFDEKDMFSVSVDYFLEEYPTWEQVVNSDDYSEDSHWIEEDHEGFKRLLEWCLEQRIPFRVEWSY